MRHSMVILTRELGERRLLWWLGVSGLVPLGMPLLGMIPPEADSQLSVALILTWLGSAVLAILLGASVLAGDLAERRLGFYLARPVSEWSLWSGKMGAAVVQALGVGALLLLPTVLVRGWPGPVLMSRGAWISWVGTTLLLVAIAHAIGVMVRSRDAWLALDLAVLGGVGLTLLTLLQELRLKAGGVALETPLALLTAGALGAFTLAGALQVLRGRSDLPRGHRLLSLTLAATLVPLALAMTAYNQWFFHPGVGDLFTARSASASADGRWIAVAGPAAHRGSMTFAFLLDLEGQRRRPIELAEMRWGPSTVSYSADGRRALWLAPRSAAPGSEVVALDLQSPARQPVTSLVGFEAPPLWLVFSPKGSRVAALGNEGITVSEIDSGRLLAKVRLDGALQGADFQDEERLRVGLAVWDGEPGARGKYRHEGFEVDLKTSRRTPLAAPATAKLRWPSPSVYVFEPPKRPLLPEIPGAVTRPVFLGNDRTAVAVRRPDRQEVELRLTSPGDPGAAPGATFRFDHAANLQEMDSINRQRLLVKVFPADPGPGHPPARSRYVLLDLEHGTQRNLGPEPPFAVTSSVLLLRTEHGFTAIDLRTGKERVLGDL